VLPREEVFVTGFLESAVAARCSSALAPSHVRLRGQSGLAADIVRGVIREAFPQLAIAADRGGMPSSRCASVAVPCLEYLPKPQLSGFGARG
jgi:hypothetical protein